MTFVKAEFPATQTQAPMLMGLLFRQVRAIFSTEDWDDLRQSHFRVMSAVPEQGVSITELGERVGMTKQGCGQFVTHLVETGHLATEPDPSDRRVRLVRRTPLGQRMLDAVRERNCASSRSGPSRSGTSVTASSAAYSRSWRWNASPNESVDDLDHRCHIGSVTRTGWGSGT